MVSKASLHQVHMLGISKLSIFYNAFANEPGHAFCILEAHHRSASAMADPFSTAAAVIGTVDVLLRFSTWLRRTFIAAGKVDAEVQHLIHDIERLIPIYNSLKALQDQAASHPVLRGQEKPLGRSADRLHHIESLWQAAGETTRRCTDTINELERILKSIVGESGEVSEEIDVIENDETTLGSGKAVKTKETRRILAKVTQKFSGLHKELKRQSKEPHYTELRRELESYHTALNTSLIALQIFYSLSGQEESANASDKVSDDIKALGFQLQWFIGNLSPSLQEQLHSAKEVVSKLSLNRYFHIPRQVSSIFTGRENELKKLQEAMCDPSITNSKIQKRFVVYGLGGSGKTEFCCKFALENRQSFWGIFTINASSAETAERSFADIAKLGGVDPKTAAAKNWLQNLEHPWLLIIDNADDPNIPVESYFPESEKGFIIVTTRNPGYKIHGNIGPKSYKFGPLEEKAANDLLLKAAGEEMPWDDSRREAATKIVSKLDFLALALIHAGHAILNRLCSLTDYLEYFFMSLRKIRRDSESRQDPRRYKQDHENVFASWEMLYEQLESQVDHDEAASDAVELLQVFAFFDCRNIYVDFLRAAVKNARLERGELAKPKKYTDSKPLPKSFLQLLKEYGMYISMEIFKDRGRPVLPGLLRDLRPTSVEEDLDDDIEVRLRAAIARLSSMSLILSEDGIADGKAVSYHLHPLVHTWVRERPRMELHSQAVWCQAAATVVTQCILIPPMGESREQEILVRALLPHVIHIEKCQKEIRKAFENRRVRRWLPWLSVGFQQDPKWAIQSAKFSIVYLKCGLLKEAEVLQRAVSEWLIPRVGIEHERSRQVLLALSTTLWLQARMNEAAEIQRTVLKVCKKILGERDPETLKVMDILGVSNLRQSSVNEAKLLLEATVEGMIEVFGEDADETLMAMVHLSAVYWIYFEYERSKELCLKAVAGLTKTNGPTGLKTLEAKMNLASTYMEMGGNVLTQAHELMIEVYEQQKLQQGKEHVLTLLALDVLARIKSKMGYSDEAEEMMRITLPIAVRNLGENHIGVLAGWTHYSEILIRLKRLEEAEVHLRRVSQQRRYAHAARNDGEHLDRIIALRTLIECLKQQGRYDAALVELTEMESALLQIGGEGLGQKHPIYVRVKARRNELEALRDAAAAR